MPRTRPPDLPRAAFGLLLALASLAALPAHAQPAKETAMSHSMQPAPSTSATLPGIAAAAAASAVGAVPGYGYGSAATARSPLSDQDFELLKTTLLFTPDDVKALRMAGEVLDGQIEAVLDVWYGYVGANPHLVHYFSDAKGAPNPDYLAAVRKRFGLWIRDTTRANYDRAWLDYQYEIGLRHTRIKKNQTDGVKSAADVIHLRYLVAFIYPITATIRPFLGKKDHSPEDVDRMYQAWFKAVTLTTVLWSQPFVPAADF